MKIWITRRSAFGIQCGGLERLDVWFTKPVYMLVYMTDKDRDNPFEDLTDKNGCYKKYGWYEPSPKTWVTKLSLGNWLGYNEEVGDYVWTELCKHFNNEPIENWDNLEKSGKCNIKDFILELDVEVKLNMKK